MPMYIRRLPVKDKHALMDPKTNNKGCAFLNPSRAGDVVCIRMTEFTDGGRTHKNKALLFDIKTESSFIVEPPWALMAPTIHLYQGIEDVRLCWFKGALWFSATSTHASSAMTSEIMVGYFNKDLKTVADAVVVDIGSRPVKNLCPFVTGEQLCLWDAYKMSIYVLEPSVANDSKRLELTIVEKIKMTFGAGIPTTPLRGSTSPIHLHGNTWGCVVHDILFCDLPSIPSGLSYIHYWMEFRIDPSSRCISFLSSPFFIAHWGIEYVSGIHTDQPRDNGASPNSPPIKLYFGIDDKIALECTTTLHDLRMGKGVC